MDTAAAAVPSATIRKLATAPVCQLGSGVHLRTTSATTSPLRGVVDLPKGFEIAPILQYGSARPYDLTNSSNTLNTGGGTGVGVVVPKSDPTDWFAFAGDNVGAQNCFYGFGESANCTIAKYDPLRGDPFFQLDTRLAKNIQVRGTDEPADSWPRRST